MKELIKSASIESLLMKRARLIEGIQQHLASLADCAEIMPELWPRLEITSGHRGYTYDLRDKRIMELATRQIDRQGWEYLMKESGIRTFMDAATRDNWSRTVNDESKVPELTRANIASTFASLYQNRETMFEDGVISIFRQLSFCYKTHNPVMFGQKIIISCFASCSFNRLHLANSGADRLDDLIRVFCLVDNIPEPDHRIGMYAELQPCFEARKTTYENDWFRLKWHKKGTCHVTFKRPDVVAKLNQIVAKRFPNAIAAARGAK